MGSVILGINAYIIFIIIIFVMVARKKRSGSFNSKINTINEIKTTGTLKNNPVPSVTPLRTDTSMGSTRKIATTLKDDKYDDWLARQLRDENKALAMVSDMFQLKKSHSNNCDAEFIKRFHESNCDAYEVDDGEKRK